ncbi:perlucin-like [Haliotis rufescens]|uniref:perlucin-like n=1 Tax=Haliotis rufescens TaxID=6454 RepID=UPI001EB01672|nr:perlucin-like [Haliotis rufescens]
MLLKLIVLCLVHYAPAMIRTGSGVKWKEFDNVLVSTSVTSEISNIYSGKLCLLLCLHNEACVSVFYIQKHRRCQFHDVLFMSPGDGDQEEGTEYYSLTTGACPSGYVHNRRLNFCYKLHHDKLPYDDGLADCTSRGEHFVVIDSSDKQSHVVKQITSSSATMTSSYYFDGSDAANEGQWVFHDGRPMTYFAWSPGHPANATARHDYIVASKVSNAFTWQDRRRGEAKYYICQKDL